MAFRVSDFPLQAKLSLILGLVSLLVYANTLKNGFVFDDFVLIKYNAAVNKGIAGIPEIFTTPYFKGKINVSFDYYRPLSIVLFAIEYEIFGDTPFAGHLVNILLFSGCVLLLFFFLDNLFEQKKTGVAFIACLLFAVHPVNTEVVANIKSSDQLLCFFFAFSALDMYIKFVQKGKILQAITGSIFFFLSLLSKETAIVLLAIIPLVFFFYRNEQKRRSVYIIAGAAVAASVYLAIRYAVLGSFVTGNHSSFSFLDNILVHAPSIDSRYATPVYVLGYYIRLLFVPYPLICDYSYNTIPFMYFSNIKVLLSLAVYLILITVGVYRVVKKHKDPFAFAIMYFLVCIALFSNIFFLIAGIMAERFLFFAVVGYCLLVALIIEKWTGLREPGDGFLINKKAIFIITPILLIYSVLTIKRNCQWSDSNTLFTTDLPKAPNNWHLLYNMGTNQLILADTMQQTDTRRNKLITEGINYLKKAAAIYAGYGLVNSEIANSYFLSGNYDSSEVYFKKSLALYPTDDISAEHLAAIYFKSQRYAQSVEICKKLVALEPGYARGYRNMGNCYLMMGKYDSAVYLIKKAMAIEPGPNISYERLAIAYKLSGNMDSAKKYLIIAQVSNPGFNY